MVEVESPHASTACLRIGTASAYCPRALEREALVVEGGGVALGGRGAVSALVASAVGVFFGCFFFSAVGVAVGVALCSVSPPPIAPAMAIQDGARTAMSAGTSQRLPCGAAAAARRARRGGGPRCGGGGGTPRTSSSRSSPSPARRERLDERGRRRPAVARVLGEAAVQDPVDVGAEAARRRRSSMGARLGGEVLGLERAAAGEQLEGDHGERVAVRGGGGGLARRLLGDR